MLGRLPILGIRPPDDWVRFRDSTTITEENIVEVQPTKMALAEEKLQDVSCIEMDDVFSD